MWPTLTGGETIDLLAWMLAASTNPRRIELIERCNLDVICKTAVLLERQPAENIPISAYSSHCRLLLLEEPSSALDPLMENIFHKSVAEAADRGTAVLPSSHSLPDRNGSPSGRRPSGPAHGNERHSRAVGHPSAIAVKTEMIANPGRIDRLARTNSRM